MSDAARVESVAALETMRSALCQFGEAAGGALATIRAELTGFVEWLAGDQLRYWKAEIRRREERVAEAKADLRRCQAATIDAHRTPSCLQEKKALAAAKRQLEAAEEKLAAVRRWIPIVEQAAIHYDAAVEPLAAALHADLPRGVAHLDRALAQLGEYLALAPPAARPFTASETIEARGPGGVVQGDDLKEDVLPAATGPAIPAADAKPGDAPRPPAGEVAPPDEAGAASRALQAGAEPSTERGADRARDSQAAGRAEFGVDRRPGRARP